MSQHDDFDRPENQPLGRIEEFLGKVHGTKREERGLYGLFEEPRLEGTDAIGVKVHSSQAGSQSKTRAPSNRRGADRASARTDPSATRCRYASP